MTSVAKDTNLTGIAKPPEKSSFFDQERVVPQISEENVDPANMTEHNVHQILDTQNDTASINQRGTEFESTLGKGKRVSGGEQHNKDLFVIQQEM